MLVKRALIWVWQGNQQPNSAVKLNSAVEHRSASFYAKAAERESAATSICHRELRHWARSRHKTQRERKKRERGRECVCVCVCVSSVCGQLSVLSTVTSPPAPNNSREKEGFTSVVWVGWMKGGEEKAENTSGEREREGWVCYKVREPRRIVILKLPDDSLFFFFFSPSLLLLLLLTTAANITRQIRLHLFLCQLLNMAYIWFRKHKASNGI